MRDDRKIKYNLIIGILGQLIMMILGIIVPKVVMTSYGSEVNGLISSVTNIYACIAIVEAGVTAASCQALYKPFSEHRRNDINAILSATQKYFHKTGLKYLGGIIAFSTIYPILIYSEIPYHVVVAVILFNGIGNVINYFFHGPPPLTFLHIQLFLVPRYDPFYNCLKCPNHNFLSCCIPL